MTVCSDLSATLSNQSYKKAQLEQKNIDRAKELTQENPNVVVTQEVLGSLEQCFNVVIMMEKDKIELQDQLNQIQRRL